MHHQYHDIINKKKIDIRSININLIQSHEVKKEYTQSID